MRSSCSRNYESCERRWRNKLGRSIDEESELTEMEETTRLYDLLRGDDGRDVREEDACLEKTQGSLHCLAATILPPGADKDQWVDQVSMRMKRMQLTNLCGAGCSQQRSRGLFKSDRGALSAKESRETLLTTRSSSERSL